MPPGIAYSRAMRFVDLPDGRRCSVLGFGCGAVMGRVGKAGSLRAMAEAFDAGVNLFDTARSYGQGQAETVLGEFLRGQRDKAFISTKFGIRSEASAGWKTMLLPAARFAARHVPAIRRAVRRQPEHQVMPAPLTPEHLHAGLEQSLRHLKTDYVDFFFLHDVPPPVAQRDDLFAAMQDLQQQGKVRWYGVSSSVEAAETMLRSRPGAEAVQMPANLFNLRRAATAADLARSRDPSPAILLANHTFGGVDRARFSRQTLSSLTFNPRLPDSLRAKLPETRGALLPSVVLPLVLRKIGADAAIVSMMSPANIRANVRTVEQDLWTDEELAQLFEVLAQ